MYDTTNINHLCINTAVHNRHDTETKQTERQVKTAGTSNSKIGRTDI